MHAGSIAFLKLFWRGEGHTHSKILASKEKHTQNHEISNLWMFVVGIAIYNYKFSLILYLLFCHFDFFTLFKKSVAGGNSVLIYFIICKCNKNVFCK